MTIGIVAVNVVVFALMLATLRPTDADVLFRFGASAPGEAWWRYVTAIFVHIGPLHLFFNMGWLYLLGPTIEERFGHARYGALYLCSGFAGAAASQAWDPGLSAGASGAVFGLLGAWVAVYAINRRAPGASAQLQSLLVLLVISFAWSFTDPRIGTIAHAGGLVAGAIIGVTLEPTRARPGPAWRVAGLVGYPIALGASVALLRANRLI